MGLFQDVHMSLVQDPSGKGVIVVLTVSERPVIQEVRFFGNKEISDGTLKDKAGLEAKQTYDQAKVAAAVRAVEDLYKSKDFYAAQVGVDTKPGTDAGQRSEER